MSKPSAGAAEIKVEETPAVRNNATNADSEEDGAMKIQLPNNNLTGEYTVIVQIDPEDSTTLDFTGAAGAIGRMEADERGGEECDVCCGGSVIVPCGCIRDSILTCVFSFSHFGFQRLSVSRKHLPMCHGSRPLRRSKPQLSKQIPQGRRHCQ
jgi:hypothetical protein